MDLNNTNPSTTPTNPTSPSGNCGQDPNAPPPLDPTLGDMSERFFTSLRKDVTRRVGLQEVECLTMPWGPKIDVFFHAKSAPGIIGGRVRLLARTRGGGDVEIAVATITTDNAPITLSGGFGCDEYVVKANSGNDPGLNARVPESYFFARVYSPGGR